MITYKLSRREKALVLILGIILVATAWFVFVYQRTNDQITRLDGELSTLDSQISIYQTRVADIKDMQDTIAERKAEGATAVEMPTYDNTKPLMAELNVIMSAATTYTLSFEDLDTSNSGYVERPARIEYKTGSYAEAESIMNALASCKYPCRIDSLQITDSSVKNSGSGSGSSDKAPVSASVHVTFFEKTAQ